MQAVGKFFRERGIDHAMSLQCGLSDRCCEIIKDRSYGDNGLPFL